MPYIKKVQVPSAWTSLETLLGTTLDTGKTYSIQVFDNSNVRLCNSTSVPEHPEDGENIKNLTQAIYKKDAGTLYVKCGASIPAFIAVSEIG